MRLLELVADRYVLLSTVSVYEAWPQAPLVEQSPALDCSPAADANFRPPHIEHRRTRCGRLASKRWINGIVHPVKRVHGVLYPSGLTTDKCAGELMGELEVFTRSPAIA